VATTGRLRFAPTPVKDPNTQQPMAQPTPWIQELIDQRATGEKRKKRNPIGFDFKREPFDPSSYYKSLNTFNEVSRGATRVAEQEAYNRVEAQRQREFDQNQQNMMDAIGGINPNFTYDDGNSGNWSASEGRRYKLGGVSKTTQNGANYFGNKYGIKTIGGWREHGSVPGSDHPKGRALDFMINNVSNGKKRGDALANDVIKNYKKFNVKYVIWNRYIWQPGRGWRKYSGPSPHTDHVHVSFNK
jgi:hypothetical protein